MKIEDANDLNDKAFPLAERRIKELANKLAGRTVIICHPGWTAELTRLSGPYNYSVFEWDEKKSETFFAKISDFKNVIIALPAGEDELAAIVAERLRQMNSDIEVLRLLRDIFMQITLQLGGSLRSQDKWKKCSRDCSSYFIFATPRSGSSFFSDVLEKTMILGHPKEHLLFDLLPVFLNTDLTFNEWIRALIRYSFSPNGYSGTKIISHLFIDIINDYKKQPELFEDLLSLFREYPIIYLKRMNKVRQAISLIKAKKSSVWHIKNNTKVVSKDQDHLLMEDPQEIDNSMMWLYEQEQNIEEFFRLAGIEPKICFYEDFADESMKSVIFRDVTNFLRIEYKDDFPDADYSIMSDEHNETLVRQYYKSRENQIRNSVYASEPLASYIMSSMMSEMSKLMKEKEIEALTLPPQRKRWWRF